MIEVICSLFSYKTVELIAVFLSAVPFKWRCWLARLRLAFRFALWLSPLLGFLRRRRRRCFAPRRRLDLRRFDPLSFLTRLLRFLLRRIDLSLNGTCRRN